MKTWRLLAGLILVGFSAFSQPGISDGAFSQATSNLTSDYYAISGLLYVIAGIIAIAGSVRVYHKWQLGEEIIKDISGWFFACLFIIIANAFIGGLFSM